MRYKTVSFNFEEPRLTSWKSGQSKRLLRGASLDVLLWMFVNRVDFATWPNDCLSKESSLVCLCLSHIFRGKVGPGTVIAATKVLNF